MSKVVLLDTSVDPLNLHCRTFQSHQICREDAPGIESASGRMPACSHGTLCAGILDEFAVDYELISIQILPDRGGRGEKPAGTVEHLREGLALCLELEADIVCLSCVSSVLSDSARLYPVVRELTKQAVLVSALDNRRYMTVPTGYPFVVGVQSDIRNCLGPGELAWSNADKLSAQVYANCRTDLLRRWNCAPSNSFAVPVAAARINDWVNRKEDVWERLKSLKPYPAAAGREYWEIPGLREDIPLVLLYSQGEEEVGRVCLEIMDQLYEKYQIQTSALCLGKHAFDIRFRRLAPAERIAEEVAFMEGHYRTDLIFITAEEAECADILSTVEVDARIRILKAPSGVRILTGQGEAEGAVGDSADLLYKLLQ